MQNTSTNVNLTSLNIPVTSNNVPGVSIAECVYDYVFYYINDYYFAIKSFRYTTSGSKIISLTLTYDTRFNTPEKIQAAHAQVQVGIDKILANLQNNTALTDVEKALLVHDRLIAYSRYDEGYYAGGIDKDSYTMYGVLAKRTGVCSGYARVYQFLMNRLGIKTYCVISTLLNHEWNIVFINNKPYYVDTTWDDPTFTLDGYVGHKNFLRSLAGMQETRHESNGTIDYLTSIEGIPITDTTYDNYYWQNSYAEFQLVDQTLYYIDNEEGTLNRADEHHTVLYTIPDQWRSSNNSYLSGMSLQKDITWNNCFEGQEMCYVDSTLCNDGTQSALDHNASSAIEHPYWWNNCSRLSSLNHLLLFTGTDCVYKYDLDRGQVSTAFIPNKTLNEKVEDYYSIFGFSYEDEYLNCYLYYSPYCYENREDYLIRAKFTGENIPQRSYSVVVSVDTNKGTISGAGNYTEGNYVTLRAENKPGYVFDGFYVNGVLLTDTDDDENPRTVEIAVNANMNVEARFQECSHEGMVEEVISATCMQNGYTLHTCPTCGLTYRSDETQAYGSHHYVGGVCTWCGERDSDCLESEHPYKNDTNDLQTLHKEGADHIAITFSGDTAVEKGYDFIYIYDAQDHEIGKYTGTELAGKRIVIGGDTVKIKLTSDSSVTKYGYALSNVEVYDTSCQHIGTQTIIRGATEPTCTEKGYTGDLYCLECGKRISTGTEIPSNPDGHCFNVWVQEPNCTEEGFTAYYCECCGYYYEDEFTPATGVHVFQSGCCMYCGYIDSDYSFPSIKEETTVKSITLGEKEYYCVVYRPTRDCEISFDFTNEYFIVQGFEYDGSSNCLGDYQYQWESGDASKYFRVEAGKTYYFQYINDAWQDNTVTVTIRFAEATYDIAYYLNGGTNHADNPSQYTTGTAVTLQAPTRNGYTFGGWYRESTFVNAVTQIASNSTGNIQLYAKWTPNTYTITYNLNGGTNNAGNPAQYTTGTAVTLQAPTRNGYTFGGWYRESTFVNAVTQIASNSTGNMQLYAKWTPNTYTITYNLNGGTNNVGNPAQYTAGTAVTLQAPTRSGYTFGGWYRESTFVNVITQIPSNSTGNIQLYAKWTQETQAKTYTITYNLSGGTNSASNPGSYTTATDTITLKNPTRKGYTFKGWYSDSKYTKAVTKIAKGSTGNKTLYAKWAKTTYTITYKLNSGTNSKSNPKTYTITTATITLKNPTRKGYTFKGWYSDAKFTKKVTKITKGSSGNKTLYAKWSKNTYTITYKLNSGTNSKSNPKTYTITTATITLKNPTRKGYTFKGWYSDAKLTKKVTKITKGSTGNKTLYAKWAKTTYTITYKKNSGTNSKSNPKTYTITTATITLKNPTRKGYTFKGWYADAKFTKKVTKITKGSTGNMTLYAKWESAGILF